MEPMVAVYPFERNSEWSRWWQSILLRGTVEPMVAVFPVERNSCGAMLAVYPFERNSCGANGGSLSF